MGWNYPHKPIMGWPIDPDHPLSDFIAFWPMHEGSGNKVFDLSGYGNTGTLEADTHWVPGKFGSALDFDGAGDYVNCGNNTIYSTLTQSMTIVTWINPSVLLDDVGTNGFQIVSKYDSGGNNRAWALSISRADSLAIAMFFGDPADGTYEGVAQTNTGAILNINQYQQIAATYDRGNLSFYLNAIKHSHTGTVPSSLYVGDADILIGAFKIAGTLQNYFNGQSDNVMIWNRALSASEIALLSTNPFIMFKDPAEIALLGGVAAPPVGANPKGPLGHPLYGALAGPISF